MANYPTSVSSFTTKNSGDTIAASHVNDLQGEVTAIEDALKNGTAHNLKPSANATYDLGISGTAWRDGFFTRNVTIGGTLAVTGAATIGGLPVLLKANSGTSTNASAENVDTIAISGLTAKDTIVVYANMGSVAQITTSPLLYNSTDAVTIVNITAGNDIAAGAFIATHATIRQAQSGNTAVHALSNAIQHAGGVSTARPRCEVPTFTTAWTGSWTLALRSGGVVAGGTFEWSWAVYKIPGQ